jgi:hypothetical protein
VIVRHIRLVAAFGAALALAACVPEGSTTTEMAAPSPGTLNTFVDGSLVVDLCSTMILDRRSTLAGLIQNGFALTKRKRNWTYVKGAGYFSVLRPGIDVTTSADATAQGCTIRIRQISQANADSLYAQLQERLQSAGYQATSRREGLFRETFFVKEGDEIFVDGSFDSNGVAIWVHRQ